MIEPLGNRVIVLPDKGSLNEHGEEISESGLITKTQSQVVSDREMASIGTVVDFGPSAWLDPALGGEPWCEKGDKVIYGKYSGKFVTDPKDKKEYVVINDDAIQARIVE